MAKRTDASGFEYDDAIAHIVAPDGVVFQILNEGGDDWLESETRAVYLDYLNNAPAALTWRDKLTGFFK